MASIRIYGLVGGLALAALSQGVKPTVFVDPQKLTMQEEPDRVVLAWTGPIVAPMHDEFVGAMSLLASDKRPIVLSLNSPGGNIAHGREVIDAMREAAKGREIDTVIEKGGVCASMCVPIYLIGQKRTAAPDAHFMFHEASVEPGAISDAGMRKRVEQAATDALFSYDIGRRRVNAVWLQGIRSQIVGHDVWLSGRQLVDQKSGVVDALVE